ncbi:hypothetical protein D9M72_314460 [compost metagenome]
MACTVAGNADCSSGFGRSGGVGGKLSHWRRLRKAAVQERLRQGGNVVNLQCQMLSHRGDPQPVALVLNSQQHHLHAEVLRRFHSLCEVIVPGEQVGDVSRPVPGHSHQIQPELKVHAFLFAVVGHAPEPDFHAREQSDPLVFVAEQAVLGGVVPVHPQQVPAVALADKLLNAVHKALVLDGKGRAQRVPGDPQPACGQEETCVNEDHTFAAHALKHRWCC